MMRNIVLITIDTLRSDHLSLNDYFRETDPNIKKIVEKGTNFTNFFSSSISTGLAFTSIYTGLAAVNHRFYTNPWNIPNERQVDDNIPTIAEIFQENGYTTVSVDNSINFRSHPKHFVKGFEYHMNPSRTPYWNHYHTKADEINKYATSWIRNHSDDQFFLNLHYWDPHTPYNQPKKFRKLYSHTPGDLENLPIERAEAGYEYVPGWGKTDQIYEETEELEVEGEKIERSIDLYDGEIRYVDEKIGEIIDLLREKELLQNTNIVITADHGEQLGEHEEYGHVGLHDSVISIPLIMKGPDVPQNQEMDQFCQHVDILPTLMDLAEVDKFPTFDGDSKTTSFEDLDGKSLLPVAKGKKNRELEKVITETTDARSIRTKNWKLIKPMLLEEDFELYNLRRDPMEINNLVEKESKKVLELDKELRKWIYENVGEDPLKAQVQSNQPTEYSKL